MNRPALANVTLGLVNCVMLAVGLLLTEYEYAKQTSPDIIFLPTPIFFDAVVGGLLIMISLFNLAVLVFVIRRQLHQHRRWLWWTTGGLVVLTLILLIVLGDRTRFVLWPNESTFDVADQLH